MIVKTKPKSNPKKKIRICGWCGKETYRFNKHHWTDGGKIWICTKCHDEIDSYLSPIEQKIYGRKDQKRIVKMIITKRKRKYNRSKLWKEIMP